MIDKNFFELEARSDIFTMTVTTTNVLGFKRGDVLTCRKTSKPIPRKIAILERDDCGSAYALRRGKPGDKSRRKACRSSALSLPGS